MHSWTWKSFWSYIRLCHIHHQNRHAISISISNCYIDNMLALFISRTVRRCHIAYMSSIIYLCQWRRSADVCMPDNTQPYHIRAYNGVHYQPLSVLKSGHYLSNQFPISHIVYSHLTNYIPRVWVLAYAVHPTNYSALVLIYTPRIYAKSMGNNVYNISQELW